MFDVAIVGAGGMASTHGRGYAAIPSARVVGVMDIREDAARTLADAVGGKAYTDFDRMLAETNPMVVDVSTPTPFHLEYVQRAAKTGVRGMVVEKPMARTVAECEQMIAACEAAGVPLFVAHVLRFFPEFSAATAQVNAGAVGEVAAVRTKRGGPFPRGWDNWFGKIDMSGGAILDLIIHDFDWLRWTFGEVERVYAKSVTAKGGPGQEVDKDFALVTLRFKSGVMAHVEGTWADPGGFKASFEIAGDKGLLECNFNQPAGAPYIAALEAGEGQRAGVAVPESPLALSPYQAELAHFLECLETGRPPLVSPKDGLEAVRIAEAATESARTGLPVMLG